MQENEDIQKLKSSESFKVPETYFEQLTADKIIKSSKSNSYRFIWITILVLIIMLIVLYFMNYTESDVKIDQQKNNVEMVELNSDDLPNLENMTLEEYEEIITQINLDMIDSEFNMEDL